MRDKNSPTHGLLKRHWHFVFLSVTLPDTTRQDKADPDAGRQAQHSNTFPIFITTSSSYKRRLLPLKSNFDVLSSTKHVLGLGSRHAEV